MLMGKRQWTEITKDSFENIRRVTSSQRRLFKMDVCLLNTEESYYPGTNPKNEKWEAQIERGSQAFNV